MYLSKKKWPVILLFSLCLVTFLLFRYRITPDSQLIYQYLESQTLVRYGTLLDGSRISLVTNSLGKSVSALPAIILSPFLWLTGRNPSPVLCIISGFIAVVGAVLLMMSFQKQRNISSRLTLILLFLISPVFIAVAKTSLEPSLILLFFGMYRYFDKPVLKYLSLLALFLSSSPAIFFVIFLLLLLRFKDKKYRLLNTSLFILTASFLLINLSKIIPDNYSILDPASHSFYIGIHKQADKVAGFNLVGKLFYNKYAVILNSFADRIAYFLDWDYWALNNVSGKYGQTSGLPPLSMVSIFELPLILIGAFVSVKKRSGEILYFIIIVFCLAFSDSFSVFLPVFLIYLIYFFVVGFGELMDKVKIKYKHTGAVVFLMVIIVFRISMLDQAEFEIRKANSRYYAYQEVSEYIKKVDSDIILTDRLGLPDLYLTFFDRDRLTLLVDSLKNSQVVDSRGFKKSVSMGNVSFSSVDDKYFEIVKKDDLSGKTFIELDEYLQDYPATDSTYFNNDYYYFVADKEVTTRLKAVRFK